MEEITKKSDKETKVLRKNGSIETLWAVGVGKYHEVEKILQSIR